MIGLCCSRGYTWMENRCIFYSRKHRSAYVMTLGVAEQYRRNGLASKLLRLSQMHMFNRFRCTRTVLHCKTDSTGALLFYGRHGFYVESKLCNYYNIDGSPYDAYLLIKDLPFTEHLPAAVTNIDGWRQHEQDLRVQQEQVLLESTDRYTLPQPRYLAKLLQLHHKTPISSTSACQQHPRLFIEEGACCGLGSYCNDIFNVVDIGISAIVLLIVQMISMIIWKTRNGLTRVGFKYSSSYELYPSVSPDGNERRECGEQM